MAEPNVARTIIAEHLEEGEMTPGEPIALKIDQALAQDATGTLVQLELEAMGLDRVRTEVAVQYVDHNLIQEDHKNPDDHRFLKSACERFGEWFSRPGNGISHAVHMARFGRPGATLTGSDSHSPAAGGLGMLAIGSGGLDVALAMAGEPLRIKMPAIWGIELTGELPDWVSAKDVILEMLRRHDVDGGVGRVIEYHGPGVANLSAMDRHVIANMGAELGATSTVFPSDDITRDYLVKQGREDVFRELVASDTGSYDHTDQIDLSTLVPLIAKPTSPGNVVEVTEVAGQPISQAYVGSSANPGYRDFAITGAILAATGAKIHPDVSFDVNPSARAVLSDLIKSGELANIINAGARLHQAGCNGCIGMGQAPASDTISLRTTPRNFPDRSGTKDDQVYLVSPETAVASAITGVITDPRDLENKFSVSYPTVTELDEPTIDEDLLVEPLPTDEAQQVELEKGPNIDKLPELEPIADEIEVEVALAMGDDISTDEILRAGAEVLPFRSNIPKIAEFTLDVVDSTYPSRAKEMKEDGTLHALVAGSNYGQGSSREHAAIAPRYLGLALVLAVDYARIHWQNLANFGVLAAEISRDDLGKIEQGDTLKASGLREMLESGATEFEVEIVGKDTITATISLSDRQREHVLAGGTTNWMRERLEDG